MKLKYTFELVDMGDEIIAVPVDDSAAELKGVIKVNKAAGEIMELLENDTTPEAVAEALAAKYDNSREEMALIVETAIKNLREMGVLEE